MSNKAPALVAFLSRLNRQPNRSHSVQKHQSFLDEVDDVDLDFLVLPVAYQKVKPLAIALRIGVVLHNQIKLRDCLVNINLFICIQEVPTLESGVEHAGIRTKGSIDCGVVV